MAEKTKKMSEQQVVDIYDAVMPPLPEKPIKLDVAEIKRHMDKRPDNLSFAEMRKSNAKRSKKVYPICQEWSAADWACALSGEVGETCNLIKKMRRGEEIPIEEIAKEIADIVLYADLLANHFGLDLGKIVRDKFNEVSDRVYSNTKL